MQLYHLCKNVIPTRRLQTYWRIKLNPYGQSWIFKWVAVAVAVAVAVVVAVVVAAATANAANKTWIVKCLKFLRIIIIFFLHIFTENSKSGCDLKIAYSRGHA